MLYILNIGLARNDGAPNNTVAQVLQDVQGMGLAYRTGRLLQSDTEPTLVIEAAAPRSGYAWLPEAVHMLAQVLGQDCIAVFDTQGNDTGLYGPNAEAWGEFNPEFFLLPDGSRLSDKAAG
jgi:hypothetical protein